MAASPFLSYSTLASDEHLSVDITTPYLEEYADDGVTDRLWHEAVIRRGLIVVQQAVNLMSITSNFDIVQMHRVQRTSSNSSHSVWWTSPRFGLWHRNIRAEAWATSRRKVFAQLPPQRHHSHIWDRIPGVRQISLSRYGLNGRIAWVLAVLLCFLATVMQIVDRIEYFYSEPIDFEFRVVENGSLIFPDVTICNKMGHQISTLRKLAYDVGLHHFDEIDHISFLLDHYNSTYLWWETGYKIPNLIKECFVVRNDCYEFGSWSARLTVLGLCYTFSFRREYSFPGSYYGLYVSFESPKEPIANQGWKVLVHDHGNDPRITVLTEGVSVYQDMRADIQISLREYRVINTRAKPCVSNSSYSTTACLADCIERQAISESPCRLPFMKGENHPLCEQPLEYNTTMTAVNKVLVDSHLQWDRCNCPLQCNTNMFRTYPDVRPNNVHIESLYTFRVFYGQMSYEVIEEKLGFGVIPLFCDIGGSLGLFLGICVLTIFEVLEAAFVKLCAKWSRK